MTQEELEKLIEEITKAIEYSKIHTDIEKEKIYNLIDKLLDIICE